MASFKNPNIKDEVGEIKRVAEEFAHGFEKAFLEEFLKRASKQSLTILESSLWSRLENTDSYEIRKGDWKQVENLSKQVNRDWQDIKDKMEKGDGIDAPIILKTSEAIHLVSGNTRLMVARCLGVTPKVLLVDMSNFDNPELVEKQEELENLKEEAKEIEAKIANLEKEIEKLA